MQDIVPLYTGQDAMAAFPSFLDRRLRRGLLARPRTHRHLPGRRPHPRRGDGGARRPGGRDAKPRRLLRRHRPAGPAPHPGPDGDRRGRFSLHGVDLREPGPQGRDGQPERTRRGDRLQPRPGGKGDHPRLRRGADAGDDLLPPPACEGRPPARRHARLRGQPARHPGDGDLPEIPGVHGCGDEALLWRTAKIP